MASNTYIEHISLLLDILLIVGVIACSISGCLRAIDSKMDIQLQSGIYALQLIGDHKQKTLKLMVK